MTYQLYRNSTIGNMLQETLDEQIKEGSITPRLAVAVLEQFDKSINTALSNQTKPTVISFKAARLETYRFCDHVWTLVLSDVEFKEIHKFEHVDTLKIVACEKANK